MPFLIAVDQDGVLRAVDFWADEPRMRRCCAASTATCAVETGQVAGADPPRVRATTSPATSARWSAVPVATVGTDFQRKVWAALQRIPAGQTRSYGQLAAEIGEPDAARAVGLANGANPIAIVVPCHRVIGADGSLTGFGGGLPRKRWLLTHEGAAYKENRAPKRPQPELDFAQRSVA